MLLNLTLPPNKLPTIQPYDRYTDIAIGPAISGTVVSGRPTLYRFDVSDLDDGDYIMDVANPAGRFVVRLNDSDYFVASEWWEIEPVVIKQNLDKSGYSLTEDFINQLTEIINDSIKRYIGELNIEVKSETKVLGPDKKPTIKEVKVLGPCDQPIVKMPKAL